MGRLWQIYKRKITIYYFIIIEDWITIITLLYDSVWESISYFYTKLGADALRLYNINI